MKTAGFPTEGVGSPLRWAQAKEKEHEKKKEKEEEEEEEEEPQVGTEWVLPPGRCSGRVHDRHRL